MFIASKAGEGFPAKAPEDGVFSANRDGNGVHGRHAHSLAHDIIHKYGLQVNCYPSPTDELLPSSPAKTKYVAATKTHFFAVLKLAFAQADESAEVHERAT